MKIRELLNEKPAVSAAILVAVLGGSLTFLYWWMVPPSEPQREPMAYFYDLNTKELFVAQSFNLGPLETESGPYQGMPAGVRANVYSCGPLVKDAVTFIGWLQVPTEAVPEDQRPPGIDFSEMSEENNLLVRLPEGDQWHALGSPEAQALMSEAQSRCGEGERITFVRPPPR